MKARRIVLWVVAGVAAFIVAVAALGLGLGITPAVRSLDRLSDAAPGTMSSYVVINDLPALWRTFRRSPTFAALNSQGAVESFLALPGTEDLPRAARRLLPGFLGRRVLYASAGSDNLLVSEPVVLVRPLWRLILASGQQRRFEGMPYALLGHGRAVAFAGPYMVVATRAEVLEATLDQLRRARSEIVPNRYARELVYGRLRRGGALLNFSVADFGWQPGTLRLALVRPAGVLGHALLTATAPERIDALPAQVQAYLALDQFDLGAAWAGLEPGSADSLGLDPTERMLLDRCAATLGRRVFVLFDGFDTDRSFAPARVVVGLETAPEFDLRVWNAAAQSLFKAQPTRDTVPGLELWLLPDGTGWAQSGGFLLVGDQDLLKRTIATVGGAGPLIIANPVFARTAQGAGHPAFFVDFNAFLSGLEPYLAYMAEQSPYFDRADVERVLVPFLHSIHTQAVVGRLATRGDAVEVEFRFLP